MGGRQLFSVGFAALTVASAIACAQGPLYRERWADLHLELLRERVVRESAGRDAEVVEQVISYFADPNPAIPFRPACAALASLRGTPCDDAFYFRGLMGAYVLPEVVDPEATKEECRQLHVTGLLPYTVELPGIIGLRVDVFDSAGALATSRQIEGIHSVEDLRMGYVSLEIPAADLVDGPWRMRLSVTIDGAEPRKADPVLEHTFHVLRGYQRRAEALRSKAQPLQGGLPVSVGALLKGMMSEVDRAYAGEAFDGSSDAVADLERAEMGVANLEAGKPILEGLRSLLPAALPAHGGKVLSAMLRWPEADPAAPKRPLVCVLPAAPALDPSGRRPSSPESRTSRWAFRRIGDFGLAGDWPIVWFQSQSMMVSYAESLPTAIAAAHELLPTDGTTIFVTELESSVAICHAPNLLDAARGVVLCGAGALSRSQLEARASLPILAIELSGHISSSGLRFTAMQAEGLRNEGKSSGFRIAPIRPRPWVAGLASARLEIEPFLRELAAAK